MSYFSRIFSTGAVRKTPARVITRILGEIDAGPATEVLEIGAGKGEISHPLLQKLSADNKKVQLYALEINEEFAAQLQKQLPEAHVLTVSAFDLDDQLPANFNPHYIISSMPLSFYSKEEIMILLDKMKKRLRPGGKILILYHAFWLTKIFRKQLGKGRLRRFLTLPPYFLFSYQKEANN
jgi:phospholipid N-methyltransferase